MLGQDFKVRMEYVGVGKRFWAGVVDSLVAMPTIASIFLALNHERTAAILILFLGLLLPSLYPIVCVSLWGQTLGKYLLKIKVVRVNGSECAWKEGILRGIVVFVVQLTVSCFLVSILREAPESYFQSTDYQTKLIAFNAVSKSIFDTSQVLLGIWYLTDTITFFTNSKYRALHDFVAGTVVVRKEIPEETFG